MKILQVLPTLGSGGAEHFTVGLTNEFIIHGHDCDVVTLYDIDKNNILLKSLNSKVHHSSLHKSCGIDMKCFYRLYAIIRNGDYEVVHAHVGAIPYLLLASILLRKVKFVATIHSEARREAGKNIAKWIRFFMFKHRIVTPVTISEESKASFETYYKMDAPMVYNGVAPYNTKGIAPLRDNDNQLLFIHPASCQTVKNQKLLIQAFSELVKSYPNVKILWLGSNESFKPLYNTLKLYMPPQFKYIGVVPNVRDYLAQADAMCLSSIMEGLPMTIIEAFSVGCPALCTPVGGIINMVEDGKNGMLSASLSLEDYYKMLRRFCELNFEQRKNMKLRAKSSFAKYSIDNTINGYLEVYKNN